MNKRLLPEVSLLLVAALLTSCGGTDPLVVRPVGDGSGGGQEGSETQEAPGSKNMTVPYDRKTVAGITNEEAKLAMGQQLDGLKVRCQAKYGTSFVAGSESVVQFVDENDKVSAYYFCNVNEGSVEKVKVVGFGQDSFEFVDQDLWQVRNDTDSAHGFYFGNDPDNLKPLLVVDVDGNAKYYTADGTYTRYFRDQIAAAENFILNIGVTEVGAEPADTDTPGAPTATPAVEVTARPTNAAVASAVVSTETPVPVEAPRHTETIYQEMSEEDFINQAGGICQQDNWNAAKVNDLLPISYGTVNEQNGVVTIIYTVGDPMGEGRNNAGRIIKIGDSGKYYVSFYVKTNEGPKALCGMFEPNFGGDAGAEADEINKILSGDFKAVFVSSRFNVSPERLAPLSDVFSKLSEQGVASITNETTREKVLKMIEDGTIDSFVTQKLNDGSFSRS